MSNDKSIQPNTTMPVWKTRTYKALLTQTGTAAPTAIILQNDLGVTVTWSRTGTGNYKAVLGTAQKSANVEILLGQGEDGTIGTGAGRTEVGATITEVTVNTVDLTATPIANADDMLYKTALEITLYNL